MLLLIAIEYFEKIFKNIESLFSSGVFLQQHKPQTTHCGILVSTQTKTADDFPPR